MIPKLPRPPLLRALYVGIALLLVVRVREGAYGGFDLSHVYQAGSDFLHGQPVYDDPFFLYLPSSALLAAPLGLISGPVVIDGGALVTGLAVIWVCFGSARLLTPGASPWVGGLTALVVLLSLPGEALVFGANVECLAVAALPLLYRWGADGRWTRFGVLLGITIAIKPILVALLLLPLLARRWKGVAYAILVPVAISAVGIVLMRHPGQIVTVTLPHVLGGPPPVFQGADTSLSGILRSLDVTGVPVSVARAMAFAVGVAATIVRWRRCDDPTLRVVEAGTLALLTSSVVSSVAWDHYAVFTVPAFVLVIRASSLTHRAWLAWPCLLPLVAGLVPIAPDGPFSYGARAGLSILAVFIIFSVITIREGLGRPKDRSAPEAESVLVPAS